MALHFSHAEFERRKGALLSAMAAERLDGLLAVPAGDRMYWLTGYDTFGFCFFQCLVRDGATAAWRCSPARPTCARRSTPRPRGHPHLEGRARTPSRRWTCARLPRDLGLAGKRLGVE